MQPEGRVAPFLSDRPWRFWTLRKNALSPPPRDTSETTSLWNLPIANVAAWIWNLTNSACPRAIQIVELRHSREKPCDIGRVLRRAAERTTEQAQSTCDNLGLGRFADLVGILRLESTDFQAHRAEPAEAQSQRHPRPLIPRSYRAPRGLLRTPCRGGLGDSTRTLTNAPIRDYYSKHGNEVAPPLANPSRHQLPGRNFRHRGGPTLRSRS